MPPISIILNPYSGRGKGARLRPALEEALRTINLDFTLHSTQGAGHASELARTARQAGVQVIVAVGGDGTVNEVVNGMVQASTTGQSAGTLALLPIGTGNDFASALALLQRTERDDSLGVRRLAQAIVARKTQRIDLGWGKVTANGKTIERYFDNSMAAGLEAQGGIYSNGITGLPAKLIYTLAALRAIVAYHAPHSIVRWQTNLGTTQTLDQRSAVISIGNSNRTGGGFRITPDAKLDDGHFDVAVIRSLPRPILMALLPLAMFGKHTFHPAVTMLRTPTLHITSNQGLPVHMDGEIIAERATEIEAKILPAKLDIVVY